MPTVAFVCTANICRSPVAEALFADWLRKRAVPGDWKVVSAGTWAMAGEPASSLSREVLGELGLDLSQHRSRPVDRQWMQTVDLILCMTRSQCEALQAEFPGEAGRIHLLSAMAGPAYDVADPYGGPRQGYLAMVEEVQQLIQAGGRRIVDLASVRPQPAGADAGDTK